MSRWYGLGGSWIYIRSVSIGSLKAVSKSSLQQVADLESFFASKLWNAQRKLVKRNLKGRMGMVQLILADCLNPGLIKTVLYAATHFCLCQHGIYYRKCWCQFNLCREDCNKRESKERFLQNRNARSGRKCDHYTKELNWLSWHDDSDVGWSKPLILYFHL